MLKGAVGRRYARAIFDIAVDRHEIDDWLRDLQAADEALTEPRVAEIMANPEIAFDAKKAIVSAALPSLGRLQRNLLHLLISRDRTDAIGEILSEFENLVNGYRGVEYADVTTAVPLNEAEAELVARKLSSLTGKKVTLRQSVDPALIGGVIARMGDRLIDGSVRGRLVALRERLTKTAV